MDLFARPNRAESTVEVTVQIKQYEWGFSYKNRVVEETTVTNFKRLLKNHYVTIHCSVLPYMGTSTISHIRVLRYTVWDRFAYRRVPYVLFSGNVVGLKKVTISHYFRFTTEDFEVDLTTHNTTLATRHQSQNCQVVCLRRCKRFLLVSRNFSMSQIVSENTV